MKNLLLALIAFIALPYFSNGQIDVSKIGDQINKTINHGKLSEKDITDGLKEALTIGSKNSASSASKVDGYLKNPKIKIPFPPQAKKVEKEIRALGMNKQVDQFVKTMNRAAEDAAKQAAPIFVDAVKKMTITDGINILNGGDSAATNYLRKKTTASLHDKFKPIIKASIQKVQVTKYWKPIISNYNKIPFVDKMNPDLEEYITDRALNGLFYLISQEETKIRKDPAAQVTELLKKVFGKK